MKKLLLLLLLFSFSFSSLLWQFGTDGEISEKPIIYRNNVVIASDDGTIYALDPNTGSKRWEFDVKGNANEVFEFDGSVISSTRQGRVFMIGTTGKEVWNVNLNISAYNSSRIYGAAANSDEIFVTADNGVYKISKGGEVTKIHSYNKTVTTGPAVGTDFVIFGKQEELIKISDSGTVRFRARIKDGSFWESDPVLVGNIVIVGALDSKMHAYLASNGLSLWEMKTRNWIAGTPISDGSSLYFGSNDANVYAVNINSGNMLWKAPTQLAVKSTPEFGFMGGQDVIFVGGSDKNIYAISTADGEIIWKGPTKGAVGSPVYYQGKVIFGTSDKSVYAFNTARACSITSPIEGALLGRKELVISGKLVSEAGGAMVLVSINGGDWIQATTEQNEWQYIADPSRIFNAGINTISCRETDGAGEESGSSYTSVSVNYDPNTDLSDFNIKTSNSVIVEGQQFTIFVNDADDGSPVERFTYTFNGQEKTSDKNITMSIDSQGQYDFTIKKIGFNDQSIQINVNRDGVDPLLLGIAAVAILIILWQVWTRFLKDRFKKKR